MLSRTTTPLLFAALFKPLCCRSFSVGIRPTAVGFPSSTPGVPTRFSSSTEGGTPSLNAMVKKTPWARKKEERSRSFAKRGRVGGWGAYSRDNSVEPEASDQTEGDSIAVLLRELQNMCWCVEIRLTIRSYGSPRTCSSGTELSVYSRKYPAPARAVPGRSVIDSCMDGAHPKMSGRRWRFLSKERTAMICTHSHNLAESQYLVRTTYQVWVRAPGGSGFDFICKNKKDSIVESALQRG